MSFTWRAIRRAPAYTPSRPQCRHIADLRPFQAGDCVILRPNKDRSAPPLLARALKPGSQVQTHKGIIPHEDIIGKRVRDVVRTAQTKAGKDGQDYRLHGVKLEEYVRLTRRLVTPLYPQDAQLIVGLLDLHPNVFSLEEADDDGPKLEMLEAGTGHGALTLFLSRAIHAANPSLPRRDSTWDAIGESSAMKSWKSRRRAIIHTIEISPKYSTHAEKIVRGFKNGIYHHNVDFHVGDVGEWVSSALDARENNPFLSHAFLDLPSAESHMKAVTSALRTDGTLIVFNPSITQIMASLAKVKEEGLLLDLDRVIELGVNGGSGGRQWDVRAVKPRASLKAQLSTPSVTSDSDEASSGEDTDVEMPRDVEQELASGQDGASEKDEWKMVCRPKVGEMIVGGGFLGVFKKQRDYT